MKKLFLTYLFNNNKQFFEELLIDELIAKTPSATEEPALTFLSNGKEKLEKWLLYQSYFLQKRSASDVKNSFLYQGGLLYIAVFLKLISQKKKKHDDIIVNGEEVITPEQKIAGAVKGLKEIINKKKIDETK